MRLLFDSVPVAAIDHVLPFYKASEFESPTRSTVPLLSWLKHEPQMVNSVLSALGMPQGCDLHLEYKVKPQKGRGLPSHTDLMVVSDMNALAIEAKWTEPRYETVSQRLVNKGANAQDVLTGWLNALQPHARHPLHTAAFSDVVYQMLHRAASACLSGSNTKMAYLVFEPSPDARTASSRQIEADLKYLRGLLGNPKSFPFFLIRVSLSQALGFQEIASLPKKQPATARQVIAALSGGRPLFGFSNLSVTRI